MLRVFIINTHLAEQRILLIPHARARIRHDKAISKIRKVEVSKYPSRNICRIASKDSFLKGGGNFTPKFSQSVGKSMGSVEVREIQNGKTSVSQDNTLKIGFKLILGAELTIKYD